MLALIRMQALRQRMKWIKFDQQKGSNQKRPPEKRLVIVAIQGTELCPEGLALGYIRYAAGDRQCPEFITPGILQRDFQGQSREIIAWCDCLGDDFESCNWRRKYMNKEQREEIMTHE